MSKQTQAPKAGIGGRADTSSDSVTTTPSSLDRLADGTVAKHVEAIKSLPDVRADRIAQMKKLIAEGKCDTPERLNAAIEKMLGELREP
ncbi:MAG: hypothetical protein EBR10_05750 [Planctomycetes bacterium]|jgi:hypothetical protein|nr:hypothetical protein [Planctomycetota bacterium]